MAIKFGRPIEMRDAPRRQTALASHPLDLATVSYTHLTLPTIYSV